MAKSAVKAIGDDLRPKMESRNDFTVQDEYNESKVKPELGSDIDVKTRAQNLARTKYNVDNQYSVDD